MKVLKHKRVNHCHHSILLHSISHIAFFIEFPGLLGAKEAYIPIHPIEGTALKTNVPLQDSISLSFQFSI